MALLDQQLAEGVRLQESLCYTIVPSPFGTLGIVWRETAQGCKVCRLLLPGERMPAKEVMRKTNVDIRPQSNPMIEVLTEQLQSFLKGDAVDFRLSLIDLGQCSEFQRKVLLAEHEIPRGWVSTYGRIARSLGMPGAARAVGTALSRNPFPIIIPCHRAIRSNGELGGFRGGVKMKRALLELEGVKFSPTGKVLTSRFYY